jgi:hypothetical protein
MSSEPDVSVLSRSIDQPDCFAVLFDRHFAQVHRYLRCRLGDELAAELAAETFLRAFRSRRRFTGEEASVLAWLRDRRQPRADEPPHRGASAAGLRPRRGGRERLRARDRG